MTIFAAANVAAMPCHTLETLPADAHLQAVGLMTSEQHPTEGKVTAIRSTIQSDGAYPLLGGCAQPRGWETEAILQEIGLNAAEIEALTSAGAAIAASPP